MDNMIGETVDDIAERIDRAGDRYHNAGHFDLERESRTTAAAVRRSRDVNQAREMARAFESGLILGSGGENAPQQMAGSAPRRPWWKWWKSPRSNHSLDDS